MDLETCGGALGVFLWWSLELAAYPLPDLFYSMFVLLPSSLRLNASGTITESLRDAAEE